MGDDIHRYAQSIGLDETATRMLENLAPEFQEEVIRSFSAEGSTNVSARLVAFCKRLIQRVSDQTRQDMMGGGNVGGFGGLAQGQGQGGMGMGLGLDQAQMEAFCQQWNLDDRSRACLESANQSVRDYVYSKFTTDEKTKSANALFMSFMKGAKAHDAMATQKQQVDHQHHRATNAYARASRLEEAFCHMASFIRKFKLDTDASALLLELTDDIRDSVMQEFQPPQQEEYSRLFTSFAHSRLRMRSMAGIVGGSAGGGHVMNPSMPTTTIMPSHFGGGGGNGHMTMTTSMPRGTRKRERSDEIDDFVAKWGLDESCRLCLETMAPNTRVDVMAEFSPPPNADNINRVFVGFAKSRGNNRGHGAMNMMQRGAVGQGQAPPAGPSPQTEAFVNQHGLDAKAASVLENLAPRMQEEIMATFNGCSDGNVNKLFMSFTKMKSGGLRR